MDINRKTAYQTLIDIEQKKQYSNIALNNHIANLKPTSPGFVRELVYGVLENKYLLDHYIDLLIPKDVSKMKKQDLTILRMGIYQIIYMNSVPTYAACNECVKLAKKYARGRDRFVNGVLRGFIKKRESLKLPDKKTDYIKYLSIKYSYEPWIVSLWLDTLPDTVKIEDLLEAGNETADVNIRVNLTKTTRDQLVSDLQKEGFSVFECNHSKTALRVKGEGLVENRLYEEGYYSIQDEASQMVIDLLDPQDDDVVADLCAAPGGKSLATAERIGGKGKVISRDCYERKVEIIAKNAKRLGLSNVVTQVFDSTVLDDSLIDKCDKVLVDAPCSGLGVIRRKPEIKYSADGGALRELPKKQLEILENGARYVKAGGALVYSTCTINSYENERVANAFLEKHKDFKKVKSRQLLPNEDGTDGFYMCKMIREERK